MSSEYSLKLKATLDTTQVQQELQKLRQQQLQASRAKNPAAPNGGAGGFDGKMLSNTLSKLNGSIVNLQRSIDSLSNISRASMSGKQPIVAAKGAAMPAIGRQAAFRNDIELQQDKQIANWFNDRMSLGAKKFARAVNDEIAKGTRTGDLLQQRFGTNHTAAEASIFKRVNGKRFIESTQGYDNITKSDTRFMKGMIRASGALIGAQMLNDIGSSVSDLGWTKTGFGISALGKGVQHAATSTMMAQSMMPNMSAGALGTVAGLSLIGSAVAAISEAMVKYAEKLKAAQEEASRILQAANSKLRGLQKDAATIKYEDKLGNMSRAQLIEERRARQAAFDDAKNNFLNKTSDEYINKRRAEINRAFLNETIRTEAGSEERVAAEKRHAEALAALAAETDRAKKNMEEQTKMLALANNALAKRTAADKAISDKEQARIEADKKIRASLMARNSSSIAGYMQSTEMTQQQIEANGILGDRSLGAIGKFNSLSQKLDYYRDLRRQAMSGAMGIAKDISTNSAGMTTTQIEEAQKKQAALESQAGNYGALADIFENAIQGISTSVTKPDISNIQSLAQYGFNMGEKDDTVDRMDKYYTKSINLQQQIKDKLQEGLTTEATYQ